MMLNYAIETKDENKVLHHCSINRHDVFVGGISLNGKLDGPLKVIIKLMNIL